MTKLVNKTNFMVITAIFGVLNLLGCQTTNNRATAPLMIEVPDSTQPASELPITYDLLGSYQWRLVSAVNSDDKAIVELSRPGFPVVAGFGYVFNDEHHVGFSAYCNGVGGPYTLTPDHTLIIGSGSQTMIGCGPKREAAEDKIKALELSSQSQLKLDKLANINTDNPELPYYLLTQKLETGETLIWKNSKTVMR